MPEPFLQASDVTVRFGGLTAVDNVSVTVDRGEVVGVIGPNGAGKTTLFGAIFGTVGLAAGSVRIDEQAATRWATHRRARAGLGRTFQRMELFGSMSVRENMEFATEAAALGHRPMRLLTGSRYRNPHEASAMLVRLGLESVADDAVASLPIGLRRQVEFGRALCARPAILLLDEPSSGLDERETDEFAAQVARAVADGVGVLLVEHDMRMVLSLCTWINVLDFGRLIASGTPAEIRTNEIVREAYLGSAGAA